MRNTNRHSEIFGCGEAPCAQRAGFGSLRGRLSHSQDRTRLETSRKVPWLRRRAALTLQVRLTKKNAVVFAVEELLPTQPSIASAHAAGRARRMYQDANSKVAKPKPRCEVCNSGFGLIRHRFAHKQFCSKHCLEEYIVKSKHRPSHFKQWIDFARG